MKNKPLLTYAGGKTKMIKHHQHFLPDSIETYSEPFFGGGAMFLYVMERYNPKKVFINDIYEGLVNIYIQVRDNPIEFCKEVDILEREYLILPTRKSDKEKNIKPCKRAEYFMEIRRQHAFEYELWSDTHRAAVLFFLMKTGFNGILQFNKNTNGRFGTPLGLGNQTEKIYDKDLVKVWSRLLQVCEITCKDYSEVPQSDLNYLDPPYLYSFTTYGKEWNKRHMTDLLRLTNSYRGTTLVCNRCVEDDSFFENNRFDFNIEYFDVTYTAGRRKKVKDGYKAKKAKEVLLYKTS